MDTELLIALLVLWSSTTAALVIFLSMWFLNEGESFHPHALDIDHRHSLFVVVNSETVCKMDCAVKNISTYVAPRGSSSSKQFTVLCVMISISGFLGTFRWYSVGDAQMNEALLALFGFASLLLVSAFELDVGAERFLEDKLLITSWLLKKNGRRNLLPFKLYPKNPLFLEFIRESKEIYHLYEEDKYLLDRKKSNKNFRCFTKYDNVWSSLHMTGACLYVLLVTASIILNDDAEEKVAWITGTCFFFFCSLGYLTGAYLPVIPWLRCWIMVWNPFLKEPHFMLKLNNAVIAYNIRHNNNKISNNNLTPTNNSPTVMKLRNRKSCKDTMKEINENIQNIDNNIDLMASKHADSEVMDNCFIRFARRHPVTYLRIVGHLLVMSELIAMLTPAIAMGIQWVTALCDDKPPVLAIIDLLWSSFACINLNKLDMQNCLQNMTLSHCILKPH